jgi:Flp pilus assembly protein TadG
MKFLKDRKALETVEAAITLPIAILVMLATINLGLVVFGQQAVQAAARHGARMGSVAQQCAACYAVTEARGAIETATIIQNPDVTILAPGGRAGSLLKIRVTGQVPNFFGGLGAIFPGLPDGPFQLQAEATFRQEGW